MAVPPNAWEKSPFLVNDALFGHSLDDNYRNSLPNFIFISLDIRYVQQLKHMLIHLSRFL